MLDEPSRDLHAALSGVDPHDPFTGCTRHAQQTFTNTFTTFTRQGPSRSGGSFKTPECVPSAPPGGGPMTRRLPHLLGADGPAVLVPARIAAVLERHADLTSLRVRTRGVDPEASAVLEALRVAALVWRGSATGTEVAAEPEPAQDSELWLSTGKAAGLAGVTSRAIRKAIGDGRLVAVEVGGRYRINREDLEHYKAARAA